MSQPDVDGIGRGAYLNPHLLDIIKNSIQEKNYAFIIVL